MIDKAKWQVMATYDALYKGQPIKADLTSLQAIAPESCFFAPLPSCEFIMSKMKLEKGIFWLAGGSTGLGQEGLKGLGMKICAQILWAIENKDYHFFKDLARLCEHGPFGRNLRSWLISIHCRPSLDKQEHFFTARELCEKAIKSGMVKEISERDMRRICAQLGIRILRPRNKRKNAADFK